MTREQFFRCSFTSGGQPRIEYVRAWTVSAAKRAVADRLASEGAESAGPIEAVAATHQPRAVNQAFVELAKASHA